MDGGVDLETVADVVKAGAESLVAGNAVFGRGYRGNAAKLLKVASSSDVTRASHGFRRAELPLPRACYL